ANLESSHPPIFSVAITAHPKSRRRSAGTDQVCDTDRACPTPPAAFRGNATRPPTPAASRRANVVVRSHRRRGSARAKTGSALFESNQPSNPVTRPTGLAGISGERVAVTRVSMRPADPPSWRGGREASTPEAQLSLTETRLR